MAKRVTIPAGSLLPPEAPHAGAPKKILTLVPKPKAEKIRVELNIERWPGIWQPAKSRHNPRLRVLKREIQLPDGNHMTSEVQISFNHLGTITTEESKMFLALIKQWEDSGRPETQVFFSDRLLARILKKGWGTNVIESTTKSLRRLRTISLEWINSYYDKTQEGSVLRERRPFTFLSELRIVERAEHGAVNRALGYFKFDDGILRNLLAHYTKPFFFEEFFSIKSDIGLLLYSHLDLMLANKQRYERSTKELFADLGLTNPDYDYMHKRKRALEGPLQELLGLRISTGVISAARVEKRQDKTDYKIVVEKSAAVAEAPDEPLLAAASLPLPAPTPRKPRAEATELVQHFYQIFHSISNDNPPGKAIDQAVALIARHGVEKSVYLVDFSRQAAEQTNFKIQTFGGILQYEARAIAAYDAAQADKERAQQIREQQEEYRRQEQEAQEQAKAELAALPVDQYQALEAAVTTELSDQYPQINWRGETAVHQGAIRAGMIRELRRRLHRQPVAPEAADVPPAASSATTPLLDAIRPRVGEGSAPSPASDDAGLEERTENSSDRPITG